MGDDVAGTGGAEFGFGTEAPKHADRREAAAARRLHIDGRITDVKRLFRRQIGRAHV